MKERNDYDFSDLPLKVLNYMYKDSDPEYKYDYIFLDEAQDFSPNQWKIAFELCLNPNGLFVVADAAQSIYENGFKWSDLNITVGSRSVNVLKKNHRNSKQILRAAQSLIEGDDELNSSDELLKPEFSTKNGPKPLIKRVFTNLNHQSNWIITDIKRRIHTGECIQQNIAIISPNKYHVEKISEHLNREGVKASYYKDNMDFNTDSVKCITIHSSKGLEFPLVYLYGIDQRRIPGSKKRVEDDEWDDHLRIQRKLLYVGMTRAMNELIITSNRYKYSELLDDIDEKYFE